MLFGSYESQKRLEEAVRVRRIIDKVKSNAEGYENGMRQDLLLIPPHLVIVHSR